MANVKLCAECGVKIGGPGNPDPYKHTIGCFNLNDAGLEHILRDHKGKTEERSMRIIKNLVGEN